MKTIDFDFKYDIKTKRFVFDENGIVLIFENEIEQQRASIILNIALGEYVLDSEMGINYEFLFHSSFSPFL
ncbi:MAG: hypothetical protein ACRCW9_00945, partial [Cetobacterium sp.]